jgi:protein TonB
MLKYPLQSRRLGEEGTVVLRILVRRDGTVGDSLIKSSSGFELLDQAAISAVKLCKLLPAITNGQPVDEWYQMPFVFKLNNEPKQASDQSSPS